VTSPPRVASRTAPELFCTYFTLETPIVYTIDLLRLNRPREALPREVFKKIFDAAFGIHRQS
jgi:hypothetical protein